MESPNNYKSNETSGFLFGEELKKHLIRRTKNDYGKPSPVAGAIFSALVTFLVSSKDYVKLDAYIGIESLKNLTILFLAIIIFILAYVTFYLFVFPMVLKIASGLKLFFSTNTTENVVGIQQEELRKNLLEQFNKDVINRITLTSQIVASIDKTKTNHKEENDFYSNEAIRYLETSIKDLYAVIDYWQVEINDEANCELGKPRFIAAYNMSKKIFNNLNLNIDPKSKDQEKVFNNMEGGLNSVHRLLKLN